MNLAKTSGLIAAGLLAGTSAASAALIDFTDNTVGAGGGTTLGGYTVTGNPQAPNTNESGPGLINLSSGETLAGDNDGLGIRDDEISGNTLFDQYITVTFNRNVRLTAAYFLDLFADEETQEQETALVSVGPVPVNPADAELAAQEIHFTGLGELTGISLIGTSFTFSVEDFLNDGIGRPDAALAAIEVSAVPLPASVLMLGAALGGLGAIGRRRKSKS